MKKQFLFLVGILILLVIVGAIYFYKPATTDSNSLTDEQILKIVKPEIDAYCQILDSNVVGSACPTCMFYYPEDKDRSYVKVNDFSEGEYNSHKYKVEKTTEGYLVTLQMYLIYGRNDRPGNQIISFNLNEDRQINNKSAPVAECK